MAEDNASQDEKIYDPSPHSIAKQRASGDLPISRDIAVAGQILIASLLLSLFIGSWINSTAHYLSAGISPNATVSTITSYFFSVLMSLGAPIIGISFLSIVLIFAVQTRMSINTSKVSLSRNFSRMWDIKKLFSKVNLVSLLENIVRIIAVIGVFWYFIVNTVPWIIASMGSGSSIITIIEGAIYPVWVTAAIFFVIGIADYAFIHRVHASSRKLTREQFKEEQKDAEAPLIIRQHIRDVISRGLSKRGTIAEEVPNATFIVTNPTHVAVAIYYNLTTMETPEVVAKGIDDLAVEIKQIAIHNRIPIREDAALARALYNTCEVGAQIPEALWAAVGHIIIEIFFMDKQ